MDNTYMRQVIYYHRNWNYKLALTRVHTAGNKGGNWPEQLVPEACSAG